MTGTTSIKYGNTNYRLAKAEDDARLRQILRDSAMPAWVTLSAEHEPNHFLSANLFGHRETLIAERDDASTVGMCSWTSLPVYLDGQAMEVGYLGELRVLPTFRRRPGIVRNGFKAVRVLAQEYPCWFTSIALDNTVARRLLEAGIKEMPRYRPLGEMVTLALPASTRKGSHSCQVCSEADIDELLAFYHQQARNFDYAPVLSESWLRHLDGSNGLRLQDFYLLRKEGRICASFALWDQRAFKQTVVRGYRFPLALLRQPYNLLAGLTRRVALPAIGQAIDYLFLAFLAIAPGFEATGMRRLIDEALALCAGRGVSCAMLGVAANHPLLDILNRYRAQTYRTCIESVSWPDQPPGEVTRADRVIQPEIALL